MKITWDEEKGILDLDGVAISAKVLTAIVDPERRTLYRFISDGKSITAIPFTEEHVIWLDPIERNIPKR
jgi:hypothetical protein